MQMLNPVHGVTGVIDLDIVLRKICLYEVVEHSDVVVFAEVVRVGSVDSVSVGNRVAGKYDGGIFKKSAFSVDLVWCGC